MTETKAEYSNFRGRGSLQDVVTELQRQIEARVDFVADTRDMQVTVGEKGDLRLAPSNGNLADFLPRDGVSVLDQALTQFGQKAPVTNGIPTRFLRNAAREHPRRTADFLTGIMHDSPDRRLVRILDGSCRAFLSDSYKVIDNYDVAKCALETCQKVGGRVLEASVTDGAFRLKMISPEIWDKIERTRTDSPSGNWYAGGLGSQEYLSKVGANTRGDLPMHGGSETVWPIATVGNSETGHGKFYLRSGIIMAICFNLATVEEVMGMVHLGSKMEVGLFSRSTLEKEADLIFCQFRDAFRVMFTQESFQAIVSRVRDSANTEIKSPSKAIELTVAASDVLSDDDVGVLVDYFTAEPGNSVYSLGQAVARMAQDLDADKADDVEVLAGEILTGKHNSKLSAALVA